jgi:hypothetical protein
MDAPNQGTSTGTAVALHKSVQFARYAILPEIKRSWLSPAPTPRPVSRIPCVRVPVQHKPFSGLRLININSPSVVDTAFNRAGRGRGGTAISKSGGCHTTIIARAHACLVCNLPADSDNVQGQWASETRHVRDPFHLFLRGRG